jgi:ferredoxin
VSGTTVLAGFEPTARQLEAARACLDPALCPTCHRRVHHGQDGTEYKGELVKRLAGIEPN